MPSKSSRSVKVVLLGSGGVGKSALTIQLIHSVFVEIYDPTIEDTYTKLITVDDATFNVEITDTAGVEQFTALHDLYMRQADGFILIFSLTEVESVNDLTSVRQQIVRLKELEDIPATNIPMVLGKLIPSAVTSIALETLRHIKVGNKCDLKAERQVPREVGVALSSLWKDCPYYETSARKRINVEEVFDDVLRQIIRRDSLPGIKSKDNKHRKFRCVVL